MAIITRRPPRPEDVPELAANMRPADRAEVTALHPGEDLETVLRAALAVKGWRLAVDIDGRLALLGGIAEVPGQGGRVGCCWMLGTRHAERFPGVVTRIGMQYRDLALEMYPAFVNFVHADNTVSIRWLRRLGFTVDPEPVVLGPAGALFHRFTLTRACAIQSP